MPHDRGERAASRQLSVVHHADLEIGQLARRLSRAETSRRAGQQDDRDGAGAEEEPDRGLDFPRRKPATRVAHGALEMMNTGAGKRHYLPPKKNTLRQYHGHGATPGQPADHPHRAHKK